MKNFRFDGMNEDEPQILANYNIGRIDIVGRFLCYAGTLEALLNKLTKWIIKYFFYSTNKKLVVNFRLAYYNTAASKIFMIIFKFLEGFSKWDKHIKVNWYYDEEDEDMLEGGQFYDKIIDIDFDLIPVADPWTDIDEIFASWYRTYHIPEFKRALPEILKFAKNKLPIHSYEDKKKEKLVEYILNSIREIAEKSEMSEKYHYYYFFHILSSINESLLKESKDFSSTVELLEKNIIQIN